MGIFFHAEINVTRWRSAAAAMVVVAACSTSERQAAGDTTAQQGTTSSSGVALTGAGATFPAPIYLKWTSDYARQTGVKINYQSLGSGAGVRQIIERTVDFGASDGPMSDEELARAKGGPILHIPTVLGAVVIAYNLPGLAKPLNLTGDVIADIFLGKITKWNDARIAALNPGVALPNTDILVVHRSDGSGTTYVFTDYLASVSPPWKAGPGRGKEVRWPVGLGGKGNEGVAGQIKQTPGSLGYVELAYATQNRLAHAAVRNAAGNFVMPSIESITAAAAEAVTKLGANTDFRVSIVNSQGAQSYPISSFTWLLVYQNQPDADKGRKLVDFIRWALREGQQSAPTLDYAPLPQQVVSLLDQRLATIKVGAGT